MAKTRMPTRVAELVTERAYGACEYLIRGVCSGRAEHIHHRKISGREHTASNCVHICSNCHRYVHANPAEAYRNGWLVKMNYEPSQVPVLRRGEAVLLDNEGGIHVGNT